MPSNVSVIGENLIVCATHDHRTGSRAVHLVGATFPVVPAGTTIQMCSVSAPEGINALALYDESARLQDNKRCIDLVLIWQGEGKLNAMTDEKMSATDLARFNPFVQSGADVLVIDAEKKVVYCSDMASLEVSDPEWVHRLVSMDTILGFITKRLTLSEVADEAVSERRAKDKLNEEIERWKHSWLVAEDLRSKEVADRLNVTAELEKSKWLYNLLDRVPARFRPFVLRNSGLSGFYGAMVLLFKDNEQDPRGC